MGILKKIAQEPTLFLFGKMWRFAEGHRQMRVIAIVGIGASCVLELVEPALIGWFLNEIQNHGVVSANLTYLIGILGVIVVLNLIAWGFHGTGRVLERRNAFIIRAQYKEYLLRGVLALDATWHGARDSGDTIDKINKSTDALFKFSDNFFLMERTVIQVVGAIIALTFFSPSIALMGIVCTVVALAAMSRFDKRLVANTRTLDHYDNRVSAKVFDALSNITSITILDVKEPIFGGLRHAIWRARELYFHNAVVNELKWFVGDNLFFIIKALALGVFIVYGYTHGLLIEVGTISALYLYITRLTNAFFTFNDIYEGIILNKVHVQNADALEKDFVSEKVRTPIEKGWYTLSLFDVYFHYEDTGRDTPHIDGVSLTLRRGEKVALIGGSGSGKTTFLKVIHGMYPSARGRVRCDERDEKETNFADFDLHTTLVPQEPEIFSSSIRENITLGTDYSDEAIVRAATLAEFASVIDQLPKGLDSVINEKGVNLSGGQKQRLALARALLFAGDKDIILLDESTSSVDSATEVKIYQHLFTHFGGRTIIASIHKLNLLKYFDRIVIFEQGRLIDEGTFAELFERNATFRQNWEEYAAAHHHEMV